MHRFADNVCRRPLAKIFNLPNIFAYFGTTQSPGYYFFFYINHQVALLLFLETHMNKRTQKAGMNISLSAYFIEVKTFLLK